METKNLAFDEQGKITVGKMGVRTIKYEGENLYIWFDDETFQINHGIPFTIIQD